MPKKKDRIPTGESSQKLGSLGDVLKQAGFTESEETSEVLESGAQDTVKSKHLNLDNVTVRKERKGRSGKTVTIIGGIDMDEPGLKRVAKKMRKSLGCGSHVEGRSIVLQGDLVERASKWLSENKAKS